MPNYEVYRGEFGSNTEISSLLGSLTFTDKIEVAQSYANQGDYPKIYSVVIKIDNPWINTDEDPFIDFDQDIVPIFGEQYAIKIALKYADFIINTNNWEDNFAESYGDNLELLLTEFPSEVNSLSMLAFPLLDDVEIVNYLKYRGYDGAIYGGYGSYRPESLDDLEYRIFDSRQILSSNLV